MLLAIGCDRASAVESPPSADESERVRKIVAKLQYVAADYADAVTNGTVVDKGEFDEQIEFVEDAVKLSANLGASPNNDSHMAALSTLKEQISSKASEPRVAGDARRIADDLMRSRRMILAPSRRLDAERAAVLFRENCTKCHGPTGAGDGPQAAELKIKPRSFRDLKTMEAMSPTRVYNALTDGIPAAEMPQFDLVSASDRWSIAYYVMSLRWPKEQVKAGESAWPQLSPSFVPTPLYLAGVTDGTLRTTLLADGAAGDEIDGTIAYVRTRAARGDDIGVFAVVRDHLAEAVAAYRSGDKTGAGGWSLKALTDGFEPYRQSLRSVDPTLAATIENSFSAQRQAAVDGEAAAAFEQRALALIALIDRAELMLAKRRSGRAAYVASVRITALAAVHFGLMLWLLLVFARRFGGAPRELSAAHIGWLAGVAVLALLWLLSGDSPSAIGGSTRLVSVGVLSLIIVVVALGCAHFALSGLDRAVAYERTARGPGNRSVLRIVLAVTAVVLAITGLLSPSVQLKGLYLASGGKLAPVAVGAITAAAVAGALLYGAWRLESRLDPGPRLLVTVALLAVVVVMSAGEGVRSIQRAGSLSASQKVGFDVPSIGLYGSTETTMLQIGALVLLAIVGVAAVLRRQPTAAPAPK